MQDCMVNRACERRPVYGVCILRRRVHWPSSVFAVSESTTKYGRGCLQKTLVGHCALFQGQGTTQNIALSRGRQKNKLKKVKLDIGHRSKKNVARESVHTRKQAEQICCSRQHCKVLSPFAFALLSSSRRPLLRHEPARPNRPLPSGSKRFPQAPQKPQVNNTGL